MSPFPIALLTNEYPPSPHGGIGVYTQSFARALCRNGWTVRVAGVYPREHAHEGPRMDEGVEVWRFPQPDRDFAGMRARATLFGQVAAWCRTGKAALVEAPDAEGWTAFWPQLPAVKVVRVHGSGSYFGAEMRRPATLRSRLGFQLERSALRGANFWSATSKHAAARTRELFGLAPCDAVLYNAVLVPAEYPRTERLRHRVVFTGTLTEKKGIRPLLQAWPQVKARVREAELHLAGKYSSGSRDLRGSITASLTREEADSVIFHGHLSAAEVGHYLETARVAVFPSFAEAFALAPMEAMARGCPTIYSTRTSGPELITSEQDGLLVDPGSPAEIADAIVRLLEDDALAQRLGYSGWQRVRKHFSFEAILPAFEDFYGNCIAARRHTRYAPKPGAFPIDGGYYL